jgi:hypothetical protein
MIDDFAGGRRVAERTIDPQQTTHTNTKSDA